MKGGEGEKGRKNNKWEDLVTEQKSPNSVQGRAAHA